MQHFISCRPFLVAALTAAVFALFPRPAAALTQYDWMVVLVDGLGRSFGLPDAPKPADYLSILEGKRNLRVEAETARGEADAVSTLAFLNYGPFSGTGWLLGSSQPTDVHLRFVLPLDGSYRLTLAARLPGHVIRVADRTVTVDGAPETFSRVDAGEHLLTAGPQEIVVTLPPGGALDYIELTAPNLPAIAPAGGWQPEAPLTWQELVLTLVQALDLPKELPPQDPVLTIEAEALAETGGARTVEDAHLGQPSGGRWLRTMARPATVSIPMTLAQDGFYDLELTAMGTPVEVLVNGHLPLSAAGMPYLAPLRFPPVYLPRGENRLDVTLPPGAGLDRITVTARRSDLAALSAAASLTVNGDAPSSADLDRLTVRLSSATR